MGWFDRKEQPSTGEFALRILLSSGVGCQTGIFTFDPTDGKRLWYSVGVESSLNGSEQVEEIVGELMNRSMDAVRRAVPSFVPGQLVVGIEPDKTGDPQIFARGPAQLLPSEWDKLIRSTRTKFEE